MAKINMKKQRDLLGRERFEIDDSVEKPKTFREREDEAIGKFFSRWLMWSLLPAGVIGACYLIPHDTEMLLPYPWNTPFIFVAMVWLFNLPNLAIAMMRSIALWFVTAGRE